MKKMLVFMSIIALTSCGGNGASEVSTDSTKVDSVVVDSVATNDSTVKVDSVSLQTEVK